MTIGRKPDAEVAIDLPLVRSLLQEQHPDLAHLALIDAGEGWDNRLFRLGDDLGVRLPRRAISAALVEREQRWLPQLAPRLPLPIPVAHRVGRPGCGFPWSWSITSWFEGRTALVEPPEDPAATAVALGRFLAALHQRAPEGAPQNPWRGVPLAERADRLSEHLRQLGGFVDRTAVLRSWERSLSAPPWAGPPLWIHGDLHPGNLLIAEGRLTAVIDFGDLTAGDPATDLAIMWMLLPPAVRSAFVEAARSEFDPMDDATLLRARGWALVFGLAYVALCRDDAVMPALGHATIDAVLADSL